MADFPKCVKAEMIPGPKLVCDFDNGARRYYPVGEQIELLMAPFDVTRLKETYGANLFIGGGVTWIGNEISITDAGDVLLNKEIIPGEMLWKFGQEHLNSPDKVLNAELSTIKHPVLAGFKSISLLLGLLLAIIVFCVVMVLLGNAGVFGH